MDDLYSIAELAKITGIPESTVRYYRNKYEEYFEYVGVGRKRRYKESAVDVLRTIAECSDRNLSKEQIQLRLNQEFAKYVDLEESGDNYSSNNVATTQQQSNSLEIVAKSLERIADQQDRIEALEKKVANYENLEQEMAALKKALEEKQDQGKQSGFLSKIRKMFD